MVCECSASKGLYVATGIKIGTAPPLQICCPSGSVIINGTCGCDSTGANGPISYIASTQ